MALKTARSIDKLYLLNGGSVHLAEGKFSEALNIYHEARQTFTSIPSPSTPMAEVYGRALLGGAEAQLDMVLYQDQQEIDLDTLIVDLRHAAGIFTLAEIADRYASAQSALALAYALDDNMEEARPALDIAFIQARRYDLRKPQLEALYRRALIGYRNKNYAAALADIEEALTLGERYAIAEFESRLRLLKGQTYEKAGQMKEALAAFRDAFDIARDSSLGRDQYVYDLASESAFRIADQLPEESDSPFAFLTLGFYGVVALVIAFLALLAYLVWMALHRKKKEQPTLPSGREAAVEATPPPTPETAPATEPPATPAAPSPSPETVSPPTATPVPQATLSFDTVAAEIGLDRAGFEISRRYAETIHLIRSDLGTFRRAIAHPTAIERLDRLERGIGKRQDLFACVEAWEEEHNSAVFTGAKPGNTVAATLRKAFTALEIDWPQSLREWDRLLRLTNR